MSEHALHVFDGGWEMAVPFKIRMVCILVFVCTR